ncbi:MAG: hypothetical protein U0670_13105 [Anaerolineae bacterium]
MDSTQIERVLVSVARKYAPTLVLLNWQRAGDLMRLANTSLSDLARELAHRGALVFGGEVPPAHRNQADLILKDWIDQWIRLHNLFADALFPTFRQLDAYLVEKEPAHVFLIATNAMPVTWAMGDIALPFVAHWHNGVRPAEAVLRDVVTAMLAHMEAGKVDRALSEQLHIQGAVLLRVLIEARVRTYSPIPYVPGKTLPERLPDLDETARLDTSDSENIAMTVSALPYTPRPTTLPEMDDRPMTNSVFTTTGAASFLPVYVPPFYPENEDEPDATDAALPTVPPQSASSASAALPRGGIDPGAKKRTTETRTLPLPKLPGKKD